MPGFVQHFQRRGVDDQVLVASRHLAPELFGQACSSALVALQLELQVRAQEPLLRREIAEFGDLRTQEGDNFLIGGSVGRDSRRRRRRAPDGRSLVVVEAGRREKRAEGCGEGGLAGEGRRDDVLGRQW